MMGPVGSPLDRDRLGEPLWQSLDRQNLCLEQLFSVKDHLMPELLATEATQWGTSTSQIAELSTVSLSE